MWPYDYFNQFSSIEIDEKVGTNKSIFVSIWFGFAKNGAKAEAGKKAIKRRQLINEAIKEMDIKKGIKFEPKIFQRKGMIFSRIIDDIIRSSLVICDLTPIGDSKGCCDNVLIELGLAMAWKLEEQVICLWDENVAKFKKEGLPSDIPTVYINKLNSKKEKKFKDDLRNIIKTNYKDFEYRKDITIKNVKSKLDHSSLRFLKDLNGLIFVDSQPGVINSEVMNTVRYLLDLGIMRTLVFKNKMTWCYYLTKTGRVILEKEFRMKLFPEIIADMLLVRYFRFNQKEQRAKIKEFENFYKIPYLKSLREFNSIIPAVVTSYLLQEIRKNAKERLLKVDVDLDLFSRYLELTPAPLDYVNNNIFPIWQKKIKSFRQLSES